MAVVSGPLLSMAASGQVGGSIVFTSWKGRPVVRQLVTPSNPQSAKQVARRAMQRFLSQNWAGISSGDQATWADLAKAKNVAPFNAYIGKNQDYWTQFNPPTQAYLGTADTPGTLGSVSGAAGVGQATITVPLSSVNNNWGAAIFAKLGSAPSGLFTEVVWIMLATASTQDAVITPLIAGTWHFKVRPFSLHGVWGTLGSDVSVTVT